MTAMPSAPKQERSRKTLVKLLDGTLRVLEKHGLEGCTMPRLAAAAGISAAAVYRHFKDKDALLRAAFLHAAQHTASEVDIPAAKSGATLEATADSIIASLLAESQANSRVQAALAQFVIAQPNATFARQARELRNARLQALVDAVLAHRDRIRHPEPERAAIFAVLAAAASIEKAAGFSPALALTPKQLAAELARAFVAYLRRKS
jgi:AcrR family transcriptional regulator